MTAVLIVITLLFGTTPLLAHDEIQIVGLVAKRTVDQLLVKLNADTTIAIAINKETPVWRNDKRVRAIELKRGVTVIVDAAGDSLEDLVAFRVRLVPPAAAPRAK
jgi:hypothetical protein